MPRPKKQLKTVETVNNNLTVISDVTDVEFIDKYMITKTDLTTGYVSMSKFGNGIVCDDRMIEIEHPNGTIYVLSIRVVHKVDKPSTRKDKPKRMSLEDLKKQMAKTPKK